MPNDWTDSYCEDAEAPQGMRCEHCGGDARPENPLLLFSATSKPTVCVHRRCYIHWALYRAGDDAKAG